MLEQLISTEDAGKMLGVSVPTIHVLMDHGALNGFLSLGNKRKRYYTTRAAVNAAIEATKNDLNNLKERKG